MIWHLGKQYTAEEFEKLPDSALAGSPAFPQQTREARKGVKSCHPIEKRGGQMKPEER